MGGYRFAVSPTRREGRMGRSLGGRVVSVHFAVFNWFSLHFRGFVVAVGAKAKCDVAL